MIMKIPNFKSLGELILHTQIKESDISQSEAKPRRAETVPVVVAYFMDLCFQVHLLSSESKWNYN